MTGEEELLGRPTGERQEECAPPKQFKIKAQSSSQLWQAIKGLEARGQMSEQAEVKFQKQSWEGRERKLI